MIIRLLTVTLLALCSFYVRAEDPEAANKTVFFRGTFDDLLKEARRTKKHILLDFTANGQQSCQKMETETFTNMEVAKLVNKKYLVYKVNVEFFDGMDLADRFEIESYPTVVLLDTKGRELNRLKGYWPAPVFVKELAQVSTTSKRGMRVRATNER